MARLKSRISTGSDEFRANEAHNRELCETLQTRLAEAREGGGGRARARHAEQGKLLVRERIARLADPGSPFLEVAPLAAHDCYDAPTPAAGLITGVASVSGRLVMVVANDAP